ncbi:MAG: hypothetical protein WCW43_01070 [Candidatus Paceibacterota bacterium]
MKMRVGIIGTGKIARHLISRLKDMGIETCFSINRSNSSSLERLLLKERPEAVFLTISTLDKGEAAREYILQCVKNNVPVITCEKGAFAYHASALQPYFNKIGCSASVGGGTRMIPLTKELELNGKVEIEAVLNGTLNFIFHQISGGISLDEACIEASKLGYAEPGATDSLSLLNGEMRDVIMKTCVLFNTVLSNGRFITPHQFSKFELTKEDLEKLTDGENYRMIVSFSNNKKGKNIPYFGRKFERYWIDSSWRISGGFRQINPSREHYSWLPGGVGNAIHIVENDHDIRTEYTMSGQGAGLKPTTDVMLVDFYRLCG